MPIEDVWDSQKETQVKAVSKFHEGANGYCSSHSTFSSARTSEPRKRCLRAILSSPLAINRAIQESSQSNSSYHLLLNNLQTHTVLAPPSTK